MEKLIDHYLEYLVLTKNTSPNTLSSYKRDLVRLTNYLQIHEVTVINEVRYSHLQNFVNDLSKRNLSDSTITRSIAAFRGYFKYLELNRIISLNPSNNIRPIKVKQKVPVVMTLEEVERFLDLPNDTNKGVRDKAMLEILYATGIRATELIRLKLSDVNIPLAFIQCDDGKKQRIIPIGKICKLSLMNYIEDVRCVLIKDDVTFNDPDTPLFVNSRGTKLSRQGFWKIIKGYGDAINPEKDISPHVLRHSFACHLIQNGADLRSVQEMMGHESIISTQIYTKISEHKLKEVYLKAHPRA